MGMMFIFCSSLWVIWEKGIVCSFTSDIQNKCLPTQIPENEANKPQDTRKERLEYTAKFLLDYEHMEWYFTKYMLANFITLLTIVAQLAYLHWIMDVSVLNFGQYFQLFNNMLTLQDVRVYNERDTAVLRFPKFFYCLQEYYGTSGTKQKFEINCNCENNNWIELFLIINIYVFMFLALLWLINLVQTLIAILLFPYFNAGPTVKMATTMKDLSYSKRLLALLLSQNVDPMLWNDVVKAINTGHIKKQKQKRKQQKKNGKSKLNYYNRVPKDDNVRKRNIQEPTGPYGV